MNEFYDLSDLMRHLVNYGADLNRMNVSQYSPFRRALDRNLLDCAEFLIRAGCDVAQELAWIQVR